MSTITDNLILALMSLQVEIKDYLKDSDWKTVNVELAGDSSLDNKELVLKVTNSRTQIGLPIIVIEAGSIYNEEIEIGDDEGKDYVTLSLLITARNNDELVTLSNMIRRKLTDYVMTVYDYRYPKRSSVGTAVFTDTTSDDLSNWNSDDISTKHVSIVNTTMEINFASYL